MLAKPEYEARTRLPDLSEEQVAAFQRICHYIQTGEGSQDPRYFLLHGLAGTGKTTVLAAIARCYPSLFLVTLTGKAASVLRTKTGLLATTIHSVFYRLVGERVITESKNKIDQTKKELIWEPSWTNGTLRGEVVLLDEASMVGGAMAEHIFATGVRVVATGDPGQLQPVVDRPFFMQPDFTLRTIHRQALESPIIRQSLNVRERGAYWSDTENFEVTRFVSADVLDRANMIIVWRNRTRVQMNTLIRQIRGLEGATPQVGETVMCLKNNNDLGIYNGATYTLLREYRPNMSSIRIDVDGYPTEVPYPFFQDFDHEMRRNDSRYTGFTFGYACTCHKSQGSEYQATVVIDEMPPNNPDWIPWAYTAFTRAVERCTVHRSW